MAQRCHLASFSNLQYNNGQGQQQQQQQQVQQQQVQQQQQQQQPGSTVKTTTTEKKRITIKRKVVMTSQSPQSQGQQSQGQQTMQEPQHQKQTVERKKITIKRKTVTTSSTITTTHSQEQPKIKQKCDDCCHNVTDYAPPATMFYQPRSDYIVPPPACSRFFIENIHCFLRQHDNACVDPSTKKVIGFWNERVGKKCNLLPVETICEENLVPVPSPQKQSPQKQSPQKQKCITKPRFVSDAHRARVASEPVALLREKLALQFGIAKQRN
jgi:hypothetical protein